MKHLVAQASAIFLSVIMASTAFAQDTAQQALDANDVAAATKLLAAQSASDDAETAVSGLCGEAQIAMESGDFDRVSELLKKAEAKDLKKKSGWNAVIAWLKADLARRQGNHDLYVSGLRNVKKVIKGGARVENDWKATIDYLLCLETKDNSDARDFAEDAIDGFHSVQMYDEEALAHLRLAELEWQRNKQKRAIKEYEAALKAYDNSKRSEAVLHIAEIQVELIGHLLEMNETKDAKSQLAKAAKYMEAAGNPAELVAKMDEFKSKLGE